MTDVSTETAPMTPPALLVAGPSRRSLIASVVAAGLGASFLPALAEAATSPDSLITIFTVAQTAEQLAVTFYSNGVSSAQAGTLKDANGHGLSPDELNYLRAALIEEQLHQLFFASVTGVPIQTPNRFNFPLGVQTGSTNTTFTDLATFIKTQQTLEGVFDSAFIAAVYELGLLGHADLARTACQIAMIESEHRVLGRDILISHKLQDATDPADNWTYAPQLLTSVGAAPSVVQNAGFFNAQNTGDYAYAQAYDPTKTGDARDLLGLGLKGPLADNVLYQSGPFVQPAGGGGPGGGAATPELGSGELLATGLVPLAGILWYRARKSRRARELREVDRESSADTDDSEI
jgi:hypothetical protein